MQKSQIQYYQIKYIKKDKIIKEKIILLDFSIMSLPMNVCILNIMHICHIY